MSEDSIVGPLRVCLDIKEKAISDQLLLKTISGQSWKKNKNWPQEENKQIWNILKIACFAKINCLKIYILSLSENIRLNSDQSVNLNLSAVVHKKKWDYLFWKSENMIPSGNTSLAAKGALAHRLQRRTSWVIKQQKVCILKMLKKHPTLGVWLTPKSGFAF